MCHQLGYPYAVAAPSHARYGEGTGPIWLDNVHCVGNESDIFTCVHSDIGNHNCMHSEDASVECLSTYVNYEMVLYMYVHDLCILYSGHLLLTAFKFDKLVKNCS